jgi:hypothetical protein
VTAPWRSANRLRTDPARSGAGGGPRPVAAAAGDLTQPAVRQGQRRRHPCPAGELGGALVVGTSGGQVAGAQQPVGAAAPQLCQLLQGAELADQVEGLIGQRQRRRLVCSPAGERGQRVQCLRGPPTVPDRTEALQRQAKRRFGLDDLAAEQAKMTRAEVGERPRPPVRAGPALQLVVSSGQVRLAGSAGQRPQHGEERLPRQPLHAAPDRCDRLPVGAQFLARKTARGGVQHTGRTPPPARPAAQDRSPWPARRPAGRPRHAGPAGTSTTTGRRPAAAPGRCRRARPSAARPAGCRARRSAGPATPPARRGAGARRRSGPGPGSRWRARAGAARARRPRPTARRRTRRWSPASGTARRWPPPRTCPPGR